MTNEVEAGVGPDQSFDKFFSKFGWPRPPTFRPQPKVSANFAIFIAH